VLAARLEAVVGMVDSKNDAHSLYNRYHMSSQKWRARQWLCPHSLKRKGDHLDRYHFQDNKLRRQYITLAEVRVVAAMAVAMVVE